MAVFIGMVAAGNNNSSGQTFLAVINRWFVRRKAVAMTLVITSYTIGGAFMVSLLSRGVEVLGWRTVLLCGGIFVVALSKPTPFFIKRSPESTGIDINQSSEAPIQPTSVAARSRITENDLEIKETMVPEALDSLTKDMVFMAVSASYGCESCIRCHTDAARKQGMTDEALGEVLVAVSLAAQSTILANGYQIPVDKEF